MDLFKKAQQALRDIPPPTTLEEMQSNLEIRPAVYQDLFLRGEWKPLCTVFLKGLLWLQKTMFMGMDNDSLFHLNAFLREFFYWWCRPEMQVPPEYAEGFLSLNVCIANATAVSSYRTTDACVSALLIVPDNMLRLLTVLNARCEFQIDRDIFFQANAWLTSVWWCWYVGAYQGNMVNEKVHANLKKHLEYGAQLTELRNFHNVYFGVTYISDTLDRPVKERVNAVLQEQISKLDISGYRSNPDPRHIAVVSGCWATNHSVWRNQRCFIEALKAEGYRLTLVHCGEPRGDMDRTDFDDFKRVFVKNINQIDMAEIVDNDFGMVYFPDVGMTMESIFLANFRLAPVMVGSYGHSCSTFGSLIDYWIGSADIEYDITERTGVSPQGRYSEKLVLIDGWGVGNVCPAYQRKPVPERGDDAPVLVACNWFGQKVTHASLKLLARIRDEAVASGLKVKFRLFSGGALVHNFSFLTFLRDAGEVLGSDVETVLPMGYEDYMEKLNECEFAIDDPSYGGCNTVADSIWLGQSVVSRPGVHWRNTIGSFIARKANNRIPMDDDALVKEVLYKLNRAPQPRRNTDSATLVLTQGNIPTGRDFARVLGNILDATYAAQRAMAR